MITWRWLGHRRHGAVWAEQERARDRVLAGGGGELLLCTHPAVVTLGRSADRGNVLAPPAELAARGIEVVQTDRGGDVTLHDEGQLMVYPIVRVRTLVGLLETVAAALGELAAAHGVPGATFQRDPAGLWLGGAKLAACGIHLRRGVAAHGWAFNVATAPARWALIRPCGLATPVVSLQQARAARGLDAATTPAPSTLARELGPALAARLG